MRFATFNIRHGAAPGRAVSHHRLRAAIASLGADVIALQEVDRCVARSGFRDQARIAASSAGLTYRFGPARALGPCGRYGNALLLPPRAHECHVVPLRSTREPRVAMFSRVRMAELFVTVVGTHLQNSRAEAVEQLDELLEQLQHWPRPWVLMGDLNLWEDDVLPRFGAAGIDPVPTGPTFPAHDPKVRIDWIGVRDLRIGEVSVPSLQSSDHLPVVVNLHLE